MKISIIKDFEFKKDVNLKVDSNYLSITDPEFDNNQAKTTELCHHQIKLPNSLKNIFNPANKKIIAHLAIDKNQNKKLVCFVNHS